MQKYWWKYASFPPLCFIMLALLTTMVAAGGKGTGQGSRKGCLISLTQHAGLGCVVDTSAGTMLAACLARIPLPMGIWDLSHLVLGWQFVILSSSRGVGVGLVQEQAVLSGRMMGAHLHSFFEIYTRSIAAGSSKHACAVFSIPT